MTRQTGARLETIPDLIRSRAEEMPGAMAFYEWTGDAGWKGTDWRTHWNDVCRVAGFLAERGLAKGDRVGIMLPVCREWEVMEKAVLLLGGIVVGIDAHASAFQKEHSIRFSGLKALLVNDAGSLDNLGAECPKTVPVLISRKAWNATELTAWNWAAIAARESASVGPAGRVLPEDPAILVFTSGTTGVPKGILYTHGQCLLACYALLDIFWDFDEQHRAMCWLPLASFFQRMINLCTLVTGTPLYLVEDPRRVMDHMASVKPSVFVGVPRFYEKLHHGIRSRIQALPGCLQRLVQEALRVSREHIRRRQAGLQPPWQLRISRFLADRLVLRRLRSVMGGRVRYMLTGSAPCSKTILEFFEALGLPLLDAYGVSENIVPVACNRPGRYRLGSVGKPLSANEIRIAPDGEILIRGPGVFQGYYGSENPRAEFTQDGFYPTGDYAALDPDGYLYLKGRKTDTIKTSSGRKISPVMVESTLAQIPFVDQVMVLGNGRKRLVALLTLNTGKTAGGNASEGISADQTAELSKMVAREIQSRNGLLAAYERVSGCVVLPRAFSIAEGELTPTLKLRRNAIETKYREVIERVYQALDSVEQQISASTSSEEPLVFCL